MSGIGGEFFIDDLPEEEEATEMRRHFAKTRLSPCYICSRPTAPGEGWHRDGRAWCPAHQPTWSRVPHDPHGWAVE